VRASVYSWSVGDLTEYQGHSIGIDCLFLNPRTETDNISLSVDVAYLTTRPRISAGVSWGHPLGASEGCWGVGGSSTEWDEVTDDSLKSLIKRIPSLTENLIRAVENGVPLSTKGSV
jgi:hypothetical protein